MNYDILFERDMLYPTDSTGIEPGSIHIKVCGPDKDDRIPVIIEDKSSHSSIKHLDTIIRIMQSDIFDRIFIDIRKNVVLYIRTNAYTDKEYSQFAYVKVRYSGDRFEITGTNL